jgi:hypothetical protein
MSALRLINEFTASNVSSFKCTDVFTDDFEMYMITLEGYDRLGGSSNLDARFVNNRNSFEIDSYAHGSGILRSYGAYGSDRGSNASNISTVAYDDSQQKGSGSVMWIFNPSSSDNYTAFIWENSSASSIGTVGRKGIAFHQKKASITGIGFVTDGNFSLRKIRIYGVRVDS